MEDQQPNDGHDWGANPNVAIALSQNTLQTATPATHTKVTREQEGSLVAPGTLVKDQC